MLHCSCRVTLNSWLHHTPSSFHSIHLSLFFKQMNQHCNNNHPTIMIRRIYNRFEMIFQSNETGIWSMWPQVLVMGAWRCNATMLDVHGPREGNTRSSCWLQRWSSMVAMYYWLVVEPTPLKNISQNGNLPQVGVKIKHIWNHHPDEKSLTTNVRNPTHRIHIWYIYRSMNGWFLWYM